MYSGRTTRWIDITTRPARVHAFTVCHFGSEAFLAETPFILALVEFEGVNTLLLTRLLGLDPQAASLGGSACACSRASCATPSSARPTCTSCQRRTAPFAKPASSRPR